MEHRATIDLLLTEQRATELTLKSGMEQLAAARAEIGASKCAQEVAQTVAEQVQTQAYGSIAAIVTRCLREVWGEEAYDFRIDLQKKRGKTEAAFQLERDGVVIDDPSSACGGGIIDVIAFALRVAALKLARPQKRMALILDEPFRFVSVEHRPALKHLLESLSRDMGVQIIMVTHIADLEIGKVVRVGEEDAIPF